MMATAGYEKLPSSDYVSIWVKLFNALYGTSHITLSQVSADVMDLFNKRVFLSRAGFLTMAFNMAQLVIGAMYLHTCPLAPMLPICLLVAGSSKLARDVLAMVRLRSQLQNVRGQRARLYNCVTSAPYTLTLWLFWVFIYVWLVVCSYYLFDTIANIMRTAERQTASQNIRAHGGFRFPPGMRSTVYVRDVQDPTLVHTTTTVELYNMCSNTLLLCAFFLISFRLALVFLNVFMGLSVTLCGILAICGAEADDLIVSTVAPLTEDPAMVDAGTDKTDAGT